MNAASDWFDQLKGDASVRSIAEAVKIPPATLGRQVKDGTIQPATVVKIARHFGKSPIGGSGGAGPVG